MKMPSFLNKFVLVVGLLFASQVFALDCAPGTIWGEFETQEVALDGEGYYNIDTPEKLAWIACKTTHDTTNYKTAKVRLTEDLDMNGKLFIPIAAGKGAAKFKGIFDGQGHAIRGLYIKGSEITNPAVNGNSAYAQNIGLVAVLSGSGIIKNLVVEVADIYAASSAGDAGTVGANNPISVGTLVGWMESGTVENCVAEGHITTSGNSNRVGGLVGNVKSATITNCMSMVSISASGSGTHVGGVVGALRNSGTVNLSSCIFAGDTLISVGGNEGGIVGYYESSTVKTQSNLLYSGDYDGVGKGKSVTTTNKDSLNTDEVVCVLNGGNWNDETKVCSGETSDVWSVGLSGLSMNGSDGYKILFDAKTGSFATGAKTFKVVAKGAAITGDEISIPTHADSVFVGWAVTSDATSPSASLGVANGSTTVYAVWKPIFKVTFSAAPGVFPEGSASTKQVSVSQGDIVSVEGFKVPETYEDASEGNKKYYFTGWAWESKKFSEDHEINPADTIHLADIVLDKDTTIYAVWTAVKTVTVTYNANEHGKTRVEFMKVDVGSAVPQPENPIADEGYSFAAWCKQTPCVDTFKFETSISENIILYASWELKRYAIKYELNKGTNNAANPSDYTIDTTDIVLADPTRDGHTFDGWFYSYSVNEGVETFENRATQITSGSTGAITLYAKWTPDKYMIRYNSGNTISGTVVSDVKIYDEPILLKGVQEAFRHKGCVQDGWSRGAHGSNAYNLDFAFDAEGKVWYSGNEDLMVYPHWTCNTYNITYNLGVGEGIAVNHRDNPGTYTGPAALTLKNAYDSQNRMYMDDWFAEETFETSMRDVQDLDADVTVYARWYNKITYYPGSRLKAVNSKLSKKEEKKYWDSTYTLNSAIKDFVLENYTLDGWATSDNGEKVYDLGYTFTDNVDFVLYPHWVESRDSVKYGAVTVYTYAVSGRVEAVIDGSSMDEIDIPEGFGVDTVIYNRTFEAGKHSTIVLPFSIGVNDVDGATFYELAQVTKQDGKWKDVEVYAVESGTLTANTPYIVTTTGSTVTFKVPVSFESTQTLDTAIVDNGDGSHWEFRGTYKEIVFGNLPEIGRAYGFAAEDKDGAKIGNFVKAGPLAWMRPMRAYLVYEPAAENSTGKMASMFDIPEEMEVLVRNEKDEVVERGVLNTRTGEIRMDSWYDLQGRKLNRKPETQGNYYHNGSRVIVK